MIPSAKFYSVLLPSHLCSRAAILHVTMGDMQNMINKNYILLFQMHYFAVAGRNQTLEYEIRVISVLVLFSNSWGFEPWKDFHLDEI